jgi:hypothetical protein
MARPPESTKTSLRQRLAAGASERWPQLSGITVRWHGEFAYVAGQLPGGTTLPLLRLRYAGSAATWGFTIYRASHDDTPSPYCACKCLLVCTGWLSTWLSAAYLINECRGPRLSA